MVRCILLVAWVAIATAAVLTPSVAGIPWPLCGTTSTFARNSTFQANLNLVAASLPRNTSTSRDLYATTVVGVVPDQVWAMALCRGDVNATVCLTCLTQAFRDLQSVCPYYKDATIYYDTCMLHYSDVHTLSDDDTGPTTDTYPIFNTGNVTSDPARFNRILTTLLNTTINYAAFNSTRRFATGEADFSLEFPKIYSLAQCVPDQSEAQCRNCLAEIVLETLQPLFLGHIGGRVLWVNCTFRFEIAPFYTGPAMVLLATPSPGAPFHEMPVTRIQGRNRRKVIIIAVVASFALFCAILVGCIMLLIRLRKGARTKRRRLTQTQDALRQWRIEEEGDSAFTLYDFSELAEATGGFSVQSRLGRGGFGPVYKGKLGDGSEIAVKRLVTHSVQGFVEFKNEIQLIAKLQHENLVRLIGCCVQEEEKMLIYEYMPNGSLDFFIFDALRGPLLDWKKRLHIIEGIVQGLLYLHKLSRVRIIHRDLKASNILLDKDLNPKISDFGVARIFNSNITEANTNRVVGTYGYMAPEYASEGIFSARSDVYSFGVLLLEIVSGKRNNDCYGDFVNLLGYAWQLWSEGRVAELINLALGHCGDTACIMRCIKVALLCVQENAMDRPTMTEVAMMLGSNRVVLKDPRQPPHFHLRFYDDNGGGEDVLEAEKQPWVTLSFSSHDISVTGSKKVES